ncbi:hypothetical protein JCGZ_25418 [Jatropha curcas]|uniref:Aminotransferase-like plant mobile domain-containing protein n=1 Tax=Jatropha curcas TaxID=180498 RepID=A0A067L5G1_JATCU|nr:hypothetical protein JCGZ_25418 [Jatropha curcas]
MRGFQSEDLLDPPMRARVVAAGFGDYTVGLRHTQPHFPPAMRYALMGRWNDCTHAFISGFGEMTLTPVDYAAITGLRFTAPVPPLDARYQTATLGAQLVRSLLGAPHRPGIVCRDERKTYKTAAHYRTEAAAEAGGAAAEAGGAAAPAGPASVVLGDVPFLPGMEVVLDPSLGLGSGIIIPADLRQGPPPGPPGRTLHMCRPRGIRRYASGSGLPDPKSIGSTLMYMSGSWRTGGCEGISPVNLVP